jgi:hypothetical protein
VNTPPECRRVGDGGIISRRERRDCQDESVRGRGGESQPTGQCNKGR